MKSIEQKYIEQKHIEYGVTLVEMMLVLVIIAMILYASINYLEQKAQQMRIDKTSTEMQQILNAGLAYYVANGTWMVPVGQGQTSRSIKISDLQGVYLPPPVNNNPPFNPWGEAYGVISGTIPDPKKNQIPMFYAYTQIPGKIAFPIASSIAGTLPFGTTSTTVPKPPQPFTACTSNAATCYVVASVNVPGQNLNNATAVNFAGLYHHGACVPVPTCPVDPNTGFEETPDILVIPVSLSGVNDATKANVYPISSFTAYATPPKPVKPNGDRPNACSLGTSTGGITPGQPASCYLSGTTKVPPGNYWRVCVQVVTDQGDVSYTNKATSGGTPPFPTEPWGGDVTLAAFTRCSPAHEPSGSGFSVYTQ